MSRPWQILIDTGGTFTDCLAVDSANIVRKLKVLSNSTVRVLLGAAEKKQRYFLNTKLQFHPQSLVGYSVRSLDGIRRAEVRTASNEQYWIELSGDHDWTNEEIEIVSEEEVPVFAVRLVTNTRIDQKLPEIDLRLGSTKGTNALLEHKVARTALITNSGFEDLLEIGTQQRPNIFSLRIDKKKQFYSKVYGLNIRQNIDGSERRALNHGELEALTLFLRKGRIESVALGFINSYRNSSQEKQLRDYLIDKGFQYVSCSSILSPEIKMLPRVQTAVVNACLAPVIEDYIKGISKSLLPGSKFEIMTSSGGLQTAQRFVPKDSLLSGPAGGIVGAASLAKLVEKEKIITLDIGGTSADVALYRGSFSYKYENTVGDATILSPALDIHTVAAGGGSICSYDGYVLTVGPESAGASPGPACYGKGGPLTLTDIALLSGRLSPISSHLPLNRAASQKKLEEIAAEIERSSGKKPALMDLISGFLQIGNEKMAEAIRKVSLKKGLDPSEYTLLAFGGAGGQFVCDIAEKLSITSVLAPLDGGLLSALGMGLARREKFVLRQALQPLERVLVQIPDILTELRGELFERFKRDGHTEQDVQFSDPSFTLRYIGQETPIEVYCQDPGTLKQLFEREYMRLMGHILARDIEVVSIRLIGFVDAQLNLFSREGIEEHSPSPIHIEDFPVFDWEQLQPGATIEGPALILNRTSTLYIKEGWSGTLDGYRNFDLKQIRVKTVKSEDNIQAEAELELFTNRFFAVAEQMGSVLERTSFSVNVKERLDFSCAILDSDGYLVVNAPHIPVHLGSLGICVRKVIEVLKLREGDIAITNHPAFGGSHLPDITLIAPIYFKDVHIGFAVNRAHHAEIGGINPGSMPTSAKSLEQEGVVIHPQLLVDSGEPLWSNIERVLTTAKYPTRNIAENIADLKGAVASINAGVNAMRNLCESYGISTINLQMQRILEYAAVKLRATTAQLFQKPISTFELLDNRAALKVQISRNHQKILLDFEGTSAVDCGNMNATPAIVNSVILYVLRLLVNQDIPLNEGLLSDIEVKLPVCLLNPEFNEDPAQCPAVVGGNTEVSQRLTDLLLKAFGLAACSQGTMNNLVFGNDRFGYYETIGGGSGAGKGFDGADAVHQHMTNTRITDPEVMEYRYPVEITRFMIRRNSGGKGQFSGGSGIIRGLRFKEPVTLNLLSQHRKVTPYGLKDGEPGKVGKQYLIRNGKRIELEGVTRIEVESNDEFIIETPGGGGYGTP